MAFSGSDRRDYYTTLPPKTTKFLQLRFKLSRVPGVYRTVKLPHNYTFAHLHTLIQFLFGWNGSHLHQFTAYTHVEKFSKSKQVEYGEMRKYGHPTPLPDYIPIDSPHYEHEKRMWDIRTESAAYYDIQPVENQRGQSPGRGVNYVDRVEEQELTLGEVWNPNKKINMGGGVCNNEELGVIYEYNLTASWMVHITLDREDDFFVVTKPRNLPIVMEAAGAPWMEDTDFKTPGELDPHKKEVSDLLFDGRMFKKYCRGEIDSVTDEKGVDIHEVVENSTGAEDMGDSDADVPVNAGRNNKAKAGEYRLNDID